MRQTVLMEWMMMEILWLTATIQTVNYPACFESDCTDTLDNDLDGVSDCDDPDCSVDGSLWW